MPKLLLINISFIFFFLLNSFVFAQQSCVTSDCHADFQAKNGAHPAEFTCADCHLDVQDSHAEGKKKTVLSEKMCTPCHDSVLDFKYNHEPVTKKSCHLCHNPHGELKQLLLADCSFVRLFVDYKEEDSYKLCFSCHKRDLLMFPDTSYSTGFRDGTKNLHFFHVNKENRGRSCKLCHGVHGANKPKMMADVVAFGNWEMPVNFTKTETGGSCAPGCHDPRSYDRKARK
ncbi:MAG: hypothetical protein KQH63_15325 [Desulfobulbaceae bacterium]|nr:hypothetical protein [Desulfobulbaceae bacterium]